MIFGICFPKDEKKLNGFILYIKRELKKYKAAYYLETAMGIYDILDNNLDVRNIIARATLAAKQCKGQYMIHEARYTEELRAKIIREQNIINEMEHALETGEFVVYFQPKYELDHCRPSGAEALVRWIRKDGTMIYPDRFIPVFEKNGFCAQLDLHMVELVCQMQRKWLDMGKEIVPISVNQSKLLFYQEDYIERLCEITDRYGISRKYIVLEILEGLAAENLDDLNHTIFRLKELGFQISMDDFGSGYSSLRMLLQYPSSIIKLDRSLVREMAQSTAKMHFIQSIVFACHQFGKTVCMEGVESAEQNEMIRNTGCDMIQGYYHYRPMELSQMYHLVSQTGSGETG